MKKSILILSFILVLTLPLYGQDNNILTPQNGGLLALVLSTVGYWINDSRKKKTTREKNGQIEAIQSTVSKIDKKVVKIGTQVTGLKENLDKEIKRHDDDLKTHSKQILQLAKNNKGK